MKQLKLKRRFDSRVFVVLAVAVVLVAGSGVLFAGEQKGKSSFAKAFAENWKNAKAYTLEVAEMMPEEHYHFKPTKDLNSFAGHLVHIASTMHFFGSKIKGEKPPAERPKADGKSKADVIAMLKKGFAYATEAIKGLSDEEAHKKINVFGDVHLIKANVVRLLNNHMTHHRGGLVIYLRLKGLKPPQYRGF